MEEPLLKQEFILRVGGGQEVPARRPDQAILGSLLIRQDHFVRRLDEDDVRQTRAKLMYVLALQHGAAFDREEGVAAQEPIAGGRELLLRWAVGGDGSGNQARADDGRAASARIKNGRRMAAPFVPAEIDAIQRSNRIDPSLEAGQDSRVSARTAPGAFVVRPAALSAARSGRGPRARARADRAPASQVAQPGNRERIIGFSRLTFPQMVIEPIAEGLCQ